MHPPTLPDDWIERIFAEMRATYGASFDRQWQAPDGVDPVANARDIRRHWARELVGFETHPHAIRYALDNLPPHPPNLVQFRAACKAGLPRDEAALALPPPRGAVQASPQVLEALRGLRQRLTGSPQHADRAAVPAQDDPIDWAERREAMQRKVEQYAAERGLRL